MDGDHHRRRVIYFFPILIGVLSGCGGVFGSDRSVAFGVINHTDRYLEVELIAYKSNNKILEQSLDVPSEHPDPDRINTSSLAQLHSTDLNKGDEIEVEITINDRPTIRTSFSLDCSIDEPVIGDILTFRVREDYVEEGTSCLTESI